MDALKNSLKKVLPPPVESFMREVNRITAMEEQNRKLIMQLQDRIDKQNQLLQQKNREIKQLEQSLRYNVESVQELKSMLSRTLEQQNKKLDYRTNTINREISYRYLKGLHPDQYREALEEWFYQHTMTKLDLDHPETFSEKIQWLKLYDSTAEKSRLADKYLVRDWIKEKIGEEYLIPLLGVWEKFDDIDFDILPDQFVLKANHGSGWNIIVHDKETLDLEATRVKFNNWMKKNFAFCNGLELHYKDIEPKIIAEKYISKDTNSLNDYKFFCFNGNIELIWVDTNRYEGQHIRNIYSPDWELLPVTKDYPNDTSMDLKPGCHEKMNELARILSKDFICVRVDFYEVDGKIYFGEMTFTSGSGYGSFHPLEFDYELGSKLKLPNELDEKIRRE